VRKLFWCRYFLDHDGFQFSSSNGGTKWTYTDAEPSLQIWKELKINLFSGTLYGWSKFFSVPYEFSSRQHLIALVNRQTQPLIWPPIKLRWEFLSLTWQMPIPIMEEGYLKAFGIFLRKHWLNRNFFLRRPFLYSYLIFCSLSNFPCRVGNSSFIILPFLSFVQLSLWRWISSGIKSELRCLSPSPNELYAASFCSEYFIPVGLQSHNSRHIWSFFILRLSISPSFPRSSSWPLWEPVTLVSQNAEDGGDWSQTQWSLSVCVSFLWRLRTALPKAGRRTIWALLTSPRPIGGPHGNFLRFPVHAPRSTLSQAIHLTVNQVFQFLLGTSISVVVTDSEAVKLPCLVLTGIPTGYPLSLILPALWAVGVISYTRLSGFPLTSFWSLNVVPSFISVVNETDLVRLRLTAFTLTVLTCLSRLPIFPPLW